MGQFAFGVAIVVVVAWVIYGLLSLLGVSNAGNIAAYAALGLMVIGGVYFWAEEQQGR